MMQLAANPIFFRVRIAREEKNVETQKAHHAVDGAVVEETETGNLRPGDVEAAYLVVQVAQLRGFHIAADLHTFEIDHPVGTGRQRMARDTVLLANIGEKWPGEELESRLLFVVHAAV